MSDVNPEDETKDSGFDTQDENKMKIFKLLGEALDNTDWGWKEHSGKEREAGARSMAATTHVFAHAIAADENLAIKTWIDSTGQPPSENMIRDAKMIQLKDPKSAIDHLTVSVEAAAKKVAHLNTESQKTELRKQKNALAGPHGDAIARSKEHGMSLIEATAPVGHDHHDNGGFIFKACIESFKLGSKSSSMMKLRQQAGGMTKEMTAIGSQLRKLDVGAVKIEQGKTAEIEITKGIFGSKNTALSSVKNIAAIVRSAIIKPKILETTPSIGLRTAEAMAFEKANLANSRSMER